VYWRLTAQLRHRHGSVSATWEFFVPRFGAKTDTSFGTTFDVNGDGFADSLVGALSPPKVFVFNGGPSGLSPTPASTIAGVLHSVSSVANAGDVNGDGFPDVVVREQDQAELFLSGPHGLNTEPTSILSVPLPNSPPSRGVGSVGDFNGDGYADIVVGDSADGRAFIFFGAPDGLDPEPAVTLEAPEPGLSFGFSVAGAGDTNGDGLGDVVVGAPEGGGHAYLYLGRSMKPKRDKDPSECDHSDHSITPAFVFAGPDGGSFGSDVNGAADFDLDGLADLFVGAPSVPAVQGGGSGRAYIVQSRGGTFTPPFRTLTSPLEALTIGTTVAHAGSMNGSQRGQVAVGGGISTLEAGVIGYAVVYTLSADGQFDEAVLTDGIPNGRFGSTFAAGDVNGDSFSDLMVGAGLSPTSIQGTKAGPGRMHVFDGSRFFLNAEPPTQTLQGEAFGVSVGFGQSVD
jgi:hypothetical protein